MFFNTFNMSQYRQFRIGLNCRQRLDNFDYAHPVIIRRQGVIELNLCRLLFADITRQRRYSRRCWSEKLVMTSLSLITVILYTVQLLNHFPVA